MTFRANGKSTVTVADVMYHRAGVPAFPVPVTLADELEWLPVVRKLETLSPLWTPRSARVYHAIVLGFFACEVIRRSTGEPVSAAIRKHVVDPLGIDLHMRLGQDEIGRLADVLPPVGNPSPAAVPTALREYAARVVAKEVARMVDHASEGSLYGCGGRSQTLIVEGRVKNLPSRTAASGR